MGEVPYNEDFVYRGRVDPNKGTPDISPRGHGRKHHVFSNNEVYGSQYREDGFGRIGLKNTSHYQKERQTNQEFKKIRQTSNSYGSYYKEKTDETGRRMYQIDQDAIQPGYNGPGYPYSQPKNTGRIPELPPIATPRGSETGRGPPTYGYSDRDSYRDRNPGDRYQRRDEHARNFYQDSNRRNLAENTINLPTIRQIQLQINTREREQDRDNAVYEKDNTIYMYPGKGCNFSTFGNNQFTVPSVSEVTLKVEDLDGSVNYITMVPKYPNKPKGF